MIDSIVVGFGVAGVSVTAHLEALGKNVVVIDGNHVKASEVAGGMYNPVILKRFSLAWNADNQLEYAKSFYKTLEDKLGGSFNTVLDVYRKFNSVKEQNTWFAKLNNPVLDKYMCSDIKESPSNAIKGDFGFGKLTGTGRIEIAKLIKDYKNFLLKKEAYTNEEFDYKQLVINNDYVVYKGVKAKSIIFCEGYKMTGNPFFNTLPFIGNKGCYLIIECSDLKLEAVLKSHFFIIPIGGNKYKFGATYEHQFKDLDHDVETKKQLITEFEKVTSAPYKIVDQIIGVRPTVIDRRPLVGQHNKYKPLYICNGMGTRGIIVAPTVSNLLVNNIINNDVIPNEININRFS